MTKNTSENERLLAERDRLIARNIAKPEKRNETRVWNINLRLATLCSERPANTNSRPAKAGDAYHPEMGERHDGTALFHAQVAHNGGYYLTWKPERHAEALAAFRSLRIRPRFPSFTEQEPSCFLTRDASTKVERAGLCSVCLSLD